MNNEKGFSLAELMVTSGLVAILGVASVTYMKRMNVIQKDFNKKSENVISKNITFGFIAKDLVNSVPSMNFLDLEASKSSSICGAENFWTLTTEFSQKECDYSVKLDKPGKEFVIVARDNSPKVIFNPSEWYDISGHDLSMSANKVKNFRKANAMLNLNKVFKLEYPGIVSGTKSGSYSSAVVFDKSSNIEQVNLSDFDIDTKEPVNPYCSGKSKNVDEFLRCLPRQGESSSVSFYAVNVIKYYLEKNEDDESKFDIYRSRASIVNGKPVFNRIRLMTKIESLEFSRISAVRPDIKFDIVF